MPTRYHIRACCGETPDGTMKMERDAFGNITSMRGISAEMLNWMANAFNTTYQCVNVPPITTVENTSKAMGSIHYLTHDVCDVGVGSGVIRYDRYKWTDFIHPWVIDPVRMLMPMPVFVSDSSALFKPLSSTVWMIILFFILVMISMLKLLGFIEIPTIIRSNNRNNKLNSHWLFVTGSLLGRSGFKVSHKISIRILMAAWILSCFVMTQLYASQLYGYLMTNIPLPVVDSAEELADKPGVDLVVVYARAPYFTITESDFPLMKKLAKKLNESPVPSGCATITDCIEMVKKSKRPTVLIHQTGPIKVGMMDDFRKTDQCSFALAQKSFDNYPMSWRMRKRDPLMEMYNRGTVQMQATGLINHWLDIYRPTPRKCLEMAIPRENPRNPSKIGLKNLAIPFGTLLAGYVLSFVIFICEKCWWFAYSITKNSSDQSL